VWWIRERVGDFGGGDSELLTAALGRGCRARRLGNAQPLAGVLPSQPPFASSLAVVGERFYVATLDEGVLSGPLPDARTAASLFGRCRFPPSRSSRRA
jgi:hypothetical protein